MAKVKSVKFYDFAGILGDWMSLNVYFYDNIKNLIPMDFSKPISSSAVRCETSLYIVTSSASYNDSNYSCKQAFHTGNVNKTVGLTNIGNCWIPPREGEWIKIEFKTPQFLSDIKILHTYEKEYGFNKCAYEIIYEDNTFENNAYVSNGKVNTFGRSIVRSLSFNQDEYDVQFDSIDFSGKNGITKVYDTKVGYVETLDTNNFRNIPINTVEKLKSLCTNPLNTHLNCLISFDKKQTWKTFNNTNWLEISDISPENIILNGMEVNGLNSLDKNKLISGGFTGDLDFKIAMKTNDTSKTPSVTKIYIEYK